MHAVHGAEHLADTARTGTLKVGVSNKIELQQSTEPQDHADMFQARFSLRMMQS